MRTARIQIILVGLILLGGVGCGKKLFQSSLQQTPSSVTQYRWRMIRTNDKAVWQSLNNSTSRDFCWSYLTYQFQSQYTVSTNIVMNNMAIGPKEGTSFKYYIEPGTKHLCIDDQSVTRTVTDLANYCRNGSTNISHFFYDLSRQGLTLTNFSPGNPNNPNAIFYEFVDDRGALNPDAQCNL